jgi:nucleoside-diphosphate-sugar epimerase
VNVLVIGGTGYLGHRIVEQLVVAGHDVSVISRGNLAPEIMKRARAIIVDRRDREAFTAKLRSESFDAVIDNICYDRDDIENAVETFGGRIQQYLFTSSMAVYHDATALDPLVEDDADLDFLPGPNDTHIPAFHPTLGHEYGNGKKRAEKALSVLDDSVFAYTALRAPIVVGPDDRTRRVWWFVQRLLDGGPIVIPEWGRGKQFQVIDADDLARAFAGCVGNHAAFNKAYNVAQPELFTAESWIESMAAALGRQARYVRVPEDVLANAGLDNYSIPIAGYPFGQFMMDTHALRCDIGFEFTDGSAWIGAMARGCAASPPPADSDGYARRDAETALAERVIAAQQDAMTTLRSSFTQPLT